jgi:hypothetical protein
VPLRTGQDRAVSCSAAIGAQLFLYAAPNHFFNYFFFRVNHQVQGFWQSSEAGLQMEEVDVRMLDGVTYKNEKDPDTDRSLTAHDTG